MPDIGGRTADRRRLLLGDGRRLMPDIGKGVEGLLVDGCSRTGGGLPRTVGRRRHLRPV